MLVTTAANSSVVSEPNRDREGAAVTQAIASSKQQREPNRYVRERL